MSHGEVRLAFLALAGALVLWMKAASAARGTPRAYYRDAWLIPAAEISGLVLACLLLALLHWGAASDVRDDFLYLGLYWVVGSSLIGAVHTWVIPMFGLSFRDDVVERRNPAALYAWLGALTGFTLAYTGSNFGDGPGYWVVLSCSALAFGWLVLAWLMLEWLGDFAERITVERDVPAGLRLGGLLLGLGLVAGRGAAGDWHGRARAIEDFVRVVAPATLLVLFGGIFERVLERRPTTPRPSPMQGVAAAFMFVAVSLGYVAWVGPW